MSQIVGTDTVKNALLTNTNEAIESVDDAESGHADLDTRLDSYDTSVTEVVAARDGEASLLAKQDAQDAAMAALAAGSGVTVSANDTTVGVLNGKLLAGQGIVLTENNDGGAETLTISNEPLSAKTADATLTAANLLTSPIFTNTGAGGAVELTLPAGINGNRFIGVVTVAQYLKFTADGTEKFRHKGEQSAAGGYVRSNTIGNIIYGYWSGSEWVLNLVGSWTYDE